MKKVRIINPNNPLVEANWTCVVENESEVTYNESWGKPERWVRAKYQKLNPDVTIYPDEQYDEVDVLDTRQQEENGEFVYYVQLKAEYTIEIEDYDPVPKSISPAQARLALVQTGLYQTVQDTVAVATDEVKIYWDYATVFERDNAILNSMANAIGITQEQLDNLFRLGVTF